MDTSRIEPTANRATALALARTHNLRVGFRGDQWAVGTAHALASNGFVVLSEAA